MTHPDKLMNKEDVEDFIKQNTNRYGSEKAVSICRQLLDTMRNIEDRDTFIVNKGLWTEFVSSLEMLNPNKRTVTQEQMDAWTDKRDITLNECDHYTSSNDQP